MSLECVYKKKLQEACGVKQDPPKTNVSVCELRRVHVVSDLSVRQKKNHHLLPW